MAPATVISDFELSLVQAVLTVFPAARVTDCLFHFAQVSLMKTLFI
jgi:transposase-like protein